MKLLDRYVLVAFVKNYLISLMVLLGLYVVLDMVFSFDELAESQTRTQMVATVTDVSKAGPEGMHATLAFGREENVPRGTEFKLFDAAGHNVGSMSVETSSAREASGLVGGFANAKDIQVGEQAVAPAPPTSMMGVIGSIVNYYAHQSFLFFVQLSGVIPVVAAAFTLIRMSRFNELTAILAAGVPLLRVAMPIVYCGVAINFVLLPITQELVIPSMIPELTKKHDELQATGAKVFPIRAMQDEASAILNAGRYTPAQDDKPAHLDVVDIIERDDKLQVTAHISADSADYDPPNGQWILKNGQHVTGLGVGQNRSQPAPIAAWKTSISPEEISLFRSSDFTELLSTDKINQLLQREKSYGKIALLRVKHFRWSQLIINIVLLLLAIPCVLTREPGTLKTDILKCVILTGTCMASIFLARQIAGNPPMTGNWTQQWPSIMAWIPIFIFLPIAIFLWDRKHTKKT